MKKKILLPLIVFCILANHIYAKSPVLFLNDTCVLNIDTTVSKVGYLSLKETFFFYKFINKGNHVTFIDDTTIVYIKLCEVPPLITRPYPSYITKPQDTTMMVFQVFDILRSKSCLKENNSHFFSLPFYYEGRHYQHKLCYKITLGKAKSVSIKNLKINVDTIVEKLYSLQQSINFTAFLEITNISHLPIKCSKSFYAYHDSKESDYYGTEKYLEILPSEKYKIPITMLMYSRYKFDKKFYLYVLSDIGLVEKIEFHVVSNYNPA